MFLSVDNTRGVGINEGKSGQNKRKYNKFPINRCLTAGLASEEMRTLPIVSLPYSLPTQPSTTTISLAHTLSPLVRRERCPPLIPRRLVHPPLSPRNGNPHSPHMPGPPFSPPTMADILLPPSKLTRDQLVRNLQVVHSVHPVLSLLNISQRLQILGTLSAPLPPELPISPPMSRSPSPSPPNKRKLPATSDSEKPKRPRTLPPRPLKAEPTEDGELWEDHPSSSPAEPIQPPIATTQAASSATVPVRRPRRGRGDAVRAIETKEKYHAYGKILKYSGDARFWSTYPPNHRHHRPLANPPPVGSPYHKNGNLIARLELVDALVSFAYSIWSNEYFHNDCVSDTWGNISEFLAWCKSKWSSEDTQGEQEKAFLGLVYV